MIEMPSWVPAWLKALIAKALALLDCILEYLRQKLHFLKPWSPSIAPTKWIFINASCCMVTFMFFLLGWMEENTAGYQFALDYYVPYNLFICVIWFAEAGLWILFDQATPAWHKLGELGLAFFFVFDGMFYLYEWKFLGYALERREILIYTVIDFFIYLFYLVLAIREEAKAQLEQHQEEGELEDVEKASSRSGQLEEVDTGFKIMK